jgi:mycoredoxin
MLNIKQEGKRWMLLKASKNLLVYALILVAGLAAGRYVPRLVSMVTPKYSEGNFSAYYPDAQTKVIVYGTETCPYCIKARAYLTEHRIAFADIDVDKSEKGRREFAQLSGKGVPLILIGNRRMTGFNKATIDAALDNAKAAAM